MLYIASEFSTRNNIADFVINLKKRYFECIAYTYKMANLKNSLVTFVLWHLGKTI